MRFALPLAFLVLASAATAGSSRSASGTFEQTSDASHSDRTGPPPAVVPSGGPEPSECRDRIHIVREERGLPRIERETADPNEYLIKAVDHRIDGCSVMVMHHDTSDVRPLPQGQPLPPRLIPLR